MQTHRSEDYVDVLDATLHRLVTQVREAVDDGTWAVSESAQLHAWLRAELLPWAAASVRTLDMRTRDTMGPVFAELAALDVELLGCAGIAAAQMAERLQSTGTRLLAALSTN